MSKQRKSKIINEAEARACALRSIEGKVDFGPDLSLPIYLERIHDARTRLGNINEMAARLDSERMAFRGAEAAVGDMSSRMLKAVLARCGPDSEEYKLAGGTPRSERKRPARRDPNSDTPPQNISTQET